MRQPIRYRIRWVDGGTEYLVVATAHPRVGTVTVELPDAQSFVADVVTARAIPMILSHIVYAVLRPEGPLLRVEAEHERNWLDLRELS
jgi:hypothetical protein